MRWPSTHSSSLKAPVPTGLLAEIGARFSTSSFGTGEEKLSASTCRKVASGRVSVNTTVSVSSVSMPESVGRLAAAFRPHNP